MSPLGLVTKGTVWYLVAGTEAGVRTFRVDRVDAVEPTGRPVVRPEGFDLAQAWASSVAEVEERRAGARVRGLADPALLPALRGRLGERLRMGDRNPDGQVEVDITGPTVASSSPSWPGWVRGWSWWTRRRPGRRCGSWPGSCPRCTATHRSGPARAGGRVVRVSGRLLLARPC